MKFSTQSTYGLRAMIRLAENWGNSSLSLSNISEEEKISLKYLERIFAKLKRGNLIKSEKGASGGYNLAASPVEISVKDIIDAIEGKQSPFYCISGSSKIYCNSGCHCAVNSVLTQVKDSIETTLDKIKLNELTPKI